MKITQIRDMLIKNLNIGHKHIFVGFLAEIYQTVYHKYRINKKNSDF